ncbi:NDP-sugar epimerase, includes UDP-GlcNAc-inverting 4,6-dehydratase FlaA1 and capsular polysaccharide biosynthesis protein EpsC [Desulfocicer vacuolatum DSM 3385]|uniref:NDP-sugar epimerase, includes UDP-GlcNAc-inverting 4,6-dehydratase FlaA1 and capsular polysaccharide biosynthesis protein EpsC n=1 Tax=Desulfocicer vacuolatum DSM 3385 TaxID=1121400 RepID=A0A1W1Z1Y5_9BACT|nr:nucleoside-diphosphate sugar epimerase/dehydratase [Desulfocicer vacuolatum]SMC42396.1 NDP-sugar epimerase, includes UDP-GlcNAc-inverting 4,6-dehydratase FlaA1 and capsular polysaccharide biosynthesis protein EpsC [Desulfocicer vacuolatum DSM 3385]
MFVQLKNVNFYVIFFIDLLLFSLSLLCAYLIRFEFVMSPGMWDQYVHLLPLVLTVKSLSFLFMQMYKGMFRYAGLADLWRLAKAVAISTLVMLSGGLLLHRFQGFSRAVFLIDGVMTLLFAGGLRLFIRYIFKEYMVHKGDGNGLPLFNMNKDKTPVLIYGAGSAGEKLYREIAENPRLRYRVVGFGDDDPQKKGRSIHGVSVLGGAKDICALKETHKFSQVLIAMPSSTGRQMRAVVDECKSCDLPFKTLPGMGELVNGKVNVKVLRDVSYRDLLRRKPVELDRESISGYLNEKVVMVTGAGGSIGSELCRQIIRFNPRQLVLLDSCEAALYHVQMELKHRAKYQRYSTVLAKIQDANLMDKVMQRHRPQVIFHAAAYKHVPMLEKNPWEAVSNNIYGNQVMVEMALSWNVERFVLVSTDKAVRPTNIMGASKRICELIVHSYVGLNAETFKQILFPVPDQDKSDQDKPDLDEKAAPPVPDSKSAGPDTPETKFMAVRFGNVVGSSGSVIPLFREQIERGGPVTVTHPDVTRYFMTIPEAAQLILQAGSQGEGGETFILEMGQSIKIADMAKDLIRLCGLVPDEDIEIEFTGLRQGEKLYEELITEGEGIVPTPHKKILVLKDKDAWNGYGTRENFQNWLMERLNELYAAADSHDICAIREKMQEIVPEFDVQDSTCVL